MSKELEALNKMGTVSEILVDLSKSHITEKEAIRQIRKCNVGDNYSIVKQALTPPTADEVCEALSEWTEQDVTYIERVSAFFADKRIATYHNENVGCVIHCNLPPHLIELIGRFYNQ
jgi:hypothetical protein